MFFVDSQRNWLSITVSLITSLINQTIKISTITLKDLFNMEILGVATLRMAKAKEQPFLRIVWKSVFLPNLQNNVTVEIFKEHLTASLLP